MEKHNGYWDDVNNASLEDKTNLLRLALQPKENDMKKQNRHIAIKQMLAHMPTGNLVQAYNMNLHDKTIRRVVIYMIKQRFANSN